MQFPVRTKIADVIFSCVRDRPQPTKVDSPHTKDVAPILRKFLARHAPRPANFVIPEFPFLKEHYRVRHLLDAINNLSQQSLTSSPGFFYKSKGFRTVKDVISSHENVRRIRARAHHIKSGHGKPLPVCTVSVARAVYDMEKKEVKRRVAWNFPFLVRIYEQMFAQPIIEQLPEHYILDPRTHHNTLCGIGGVKTDFSNFDASVPYWLLEACVNNLFSRIEDEYEDGGKKITLMPLLDAIRQYILRTPYIYKGRRFVKYHGVPSGSAFTNILDSMASYALLFNAHRKCLGPLYIATYGDDAAYRCEGCRFEDVARYLEGECGMKVKKEEGLGNNCLVYCKKYCYLGEPIHPTLWFINILNCVRHWKYRRGVAWQLAHWPFNPTPDQYDLLIKRYRARPGPLPRRLLEYLNLLRE
uniref:RdRp n=1 Tax=Hubei partiti-like virus 51 TaxID=1923060 RepID=A0A1L3KLN4_9VIRU|nr:RdRp [Hubei partiti-like virus 51]